MAGQGRKVFTAGDVLTAAQVQDYLQDQAVMNFAGTAARSSAIASPTEGMVSIQTDVDDLTYYNGTSWTAGLSFGAWKTWSPTLSGGWTPAGTHTAKYVQIGKTVIANDYFQLTGTSAGSGLTISLPVTAVNSANLNGVAWAGTTSSSGFSQMHVFPTTTTTISLFGNNSAGTYLASGGVTSTVPVTWAIGSVFSFTVIYEAA
jgi:hypothetical protein